MRNLQLSFLLGVLCLGFCTSAQAQTAQRESHGHGYAFFAPGGIGKTSSVTGHVGVGGEGIFGNGIGLGAEIGYVAQLKDWGDGFGLFSINGAYHFKNSSKVIPFVTGGYSGFFRGGYANGFNFGGGVNYWMKERVGLRFEFRDQVPGNTDAGHFYEIRFGVTFR